MKLFQLFLFGILLIGFQELKAQDTGEVFTISYIMPRYLIDDCGDMDKDACSNKNIGNYIMNQFTYPQEAIEKNWQGKAYVKFVVNKQGEIEQVEILKSAGYELLDIAAKQLIQGIPGTWSPGLNEQNEPVAVQLVLPVNFKLQ